MYRTKRGKLRPVARLRELLCVTCVLAIAHWGFADAPIDDQHKFAWGENIGWTNWRDADSGNAGVVIGPTFLGGFIWGENVGWINTGDGSPADGVHYANLDGTDYGVNRDPATDFLFGLAWGENVGWVNFDTSSLGGDRARFDLCLGRFLGYAWGENVGWINLDDSTHYVATILESDCNTNGVEDACDISDGASQDCNTNGLPDECEQDLDGDGLIDDCDDDIDDDGVGNDQDDCK